MTSLPPNIFLFLIFVFGLCIGSFINVLAWRLPQQRKIDGRSKCANCGKVLRWYELVPLFSYIVQQGSCRSCKQPISPRYPIIELATAIIFAAVAMQFSPTNLLSALTILKALFVAALCITIFIIDFEHYLILDVLVFPGIAVALVLNAVIDLVAKTSFISSSSATGSGVLGALLGFVPFWLLWRVSKGRWMGFGDVKYVIFMGLVLGWSSMVVGLFLGFMIGAIVGLGLMIVGRKQLSSKIPFGTFLTVATMISLVWGQALWQSYRALIGW